MRVSAHSLGNAIVTLAAGMALAVLAHAQQALPVSPPLITLTDAITRARQYSGQIQTANLASLLATEDRVQARAAELPSLTSGNGFIYTQPNGTSSGVFVANNGVREYIAQAGVHQEALALVRHGEVRRAMAAEAVARARVDVASRGLTATVVQNYYAVVNAQRRLANSQRSVAESQRFFDITQQLEQRGEAARADSIRAQIDLQQRQRDLQEAETSIEKAKIALGVLIFPNFSSVFDVVDDLQPPALLPQFAEADVQARVANPDVKAASAGVQQAEYDVSVARYAYLPSLALDVFYGLDSNQFARRTRLPPGSEMPYQQNLGYVAQGTLNIPVWNWGTTRSKVKQAEFKRNQAQLDLSVTQRTLQSNIAAIYAEARLAQQQLDSLRTSVDLAVESLRLTLLRYQAGESTALEVVDAQNTATLARNAYDDGLARYRIALANLQILTGNL